MAADWSDLAEALAPAFEEAEGLTVEMLESLATAKPEPKPTVKALALLVGAYAQSAVIAETTGGVDADETFLTFARLVSGYMKERAR